MTTGFHQNGPISQTSQCRPRKLIFSWFTGKHGEYFYILIPCDWTFKTLKGSNLQQPVLATRRFDGQQELSQFRPNVRNQHRLLLFLLFRCLQKTNIATIYFFYFVQNSFTFTLCTLKCIMTFSVDKSLLYFPFGFWFKGTICKMSSLVPGLSDL